MTQQEFKNVTISGSLKILIFFVQTMFYLTSNLLPNMSSNSKNFLSNFNYTLQGIQCSFMFLRDQSGHFKLFLYNMLGPFALIAILLSLVTLKLFIQYVRNLISKHNEMKLLTEEQVPLIGNIEEEKQWKTICVSTILYTLYMVYYGVSTLVIKNFACIPVIHKM